jgi:hypothetical protein
MPAALANCLLWLEIWPRLAFARLLVRYVGFARWRALLGPIDGDPAVDEPPQLAPAQAERAAHIGRQIDRVARHALLFRALCLPRAMAARWMLARRGIPSRIVIGSRRAETGAGGGHMFHAWLVAGDQVITGAQDRDEYLALQRQTPAAAVTIGQDD